MKETLFRFPALPRGADWYEEALRYRIRARPKPKFKTVLDATRLFGGGGGACRVSTRLRRGADRGLDYELTIEHTLGQLRIRDHLTCRDEGGLRAARLTRTQSADGAETRRQIADFDLPGLPLPRATYPDVLLPFVMRGQPLDGVTRAAYGWTSDSFVSRVYYESRQAMTIQVPAGRFRVREVWMYPDLNDWIPMGGVLTKLSKPLLPRYTMWYEEAAPHRVIRYEGAYGPPGAPELVLELEG